MSNANNADNKQFFSKILNSIGAGVVIALVPNALLGEVLKIFKSGNEILELTYQLVILIQSFMAFIIGVLAAHQFKFNGSGAVVYSNNSFMLKGIGDIINTSLVVIIACLIYMVLQNKLGSFELIILPVLVPIVSGGIGLITLPYIRKITQAIGNVIHSFTDLNPLLMSILISVAFSLLMVTPISLVAIATAISLNGLGSGAANLGIVAACVTFLFGSLRVNSIGVNAVLLIGAAKMMIPVYLKNLIISIPLTINGIITGIIAYVLQVKGTPLSAGFGYTGLVGPINAFNRMSGDPTMNIILLALGYFVIPFVSAFIVHELCKKFIPIYSNDIYKFEVPKQ
ncbi:PTS transporter subunit IIC [Staphylococcus aureus]|uniref:PTS transporter subunit IIC n=1 Tax=Staphylococcus aureus TaxID=1280 RepID=UPI000802F51B|nr:PTS transporter subunit IIC [Staphylococcus aureus]MBK4072519.1 PTS transporter subunit IIC [Staphylococcus aureus]OBX95946.1 membrane protein [Staphylococcus aureus]OBY01027.1 membrane protein [Staphylococcus aureus]